VWRWMHHGPAGDDRQPRRRDRRQTTEHQRQNRERGRSPAPGEPTPAPPALRTTNSHLSLLQPGSPGRAPRPSGSPGITRTGLSGQRALGRHRSTIEGRDVGVQVNADAVGAAAPCVQSNCTRAKLPGGRSHRCSPDRCSRWSPDPRR
jgi:hypothetical protein